jgi:predicted amidohydrolase YtcJ
MLADFAVLSADYFSVPDGEVAALESVLTVVGGKVVYEAGPYSRGSTGSRTAKAA